jgi:hypothetical protein
MTRSQKPYHRDTYSNGVEPAVGDLIIEVGSTNRVAFVLMTTLHGYKHIAEIEWISGGVGRRSIDVGRFIKVSDV